MYIDYIVQRSNLLIRIYISVTKQHAKIPFSETKKIKQIKIKNGNKMQNAKHSNTRWDKCIMKLLILISIHTHACRDKMQKKNDDDDRTNYLKSKKNALEYY